MKKILFSLFLILFSIWSNANSTSLNSIKEIGLVIEKLDNDSCNVKSSDLETSVKYILSNSKIKFKDHHIKGKPYLHITPVVLHDKINNICAGNIGFSIKIISREPNNPKKVNIGTFIYYYENKIFYSQSNVFTKKLTDGIEKMTKELIVKWNKDNK